jgi:hypothetical protein
MTNDLAARVLAAIDETERIALHAHGDTWTAHGWHLVKSSDGEEVVTVGDSGGGVYDDPTANHIAGNDPATVLRRCAADRKIVELHPPNTAIGAHGKPVLVVCATCTPGIAGQILGRDRQPGHARRSARSPPATASPPRRPCDRPAHTARRLRRRGFLQRRVAPAKP